MPLRKTFSAVFRAQHWNVQRVNLTTPFLFPVEFQVVKNDPKIVVTSGLLVLWLSEELKDVLGRGVGLCQHRCAGLHQNLVLRELRRLLREVRVTNTRFRVRQVFDRHVQAVDVGHQRVLLERAHLRSERGYAADSGVNDLNGLLLTLWDDDSPHFELYMRGIIAFAEYTWSGEKRMKEAHLFWRR